MILVDTSIWIDHLRTDDATLATLLEQNRVLTHPFVIGEIALGSLRQRDMVLGALSALPQATVALDNEVFRMIGDETLHGVGIGYIDAHLLAAVRLTPGTALWTRDRRLQAVAERLGIAARTAH
ncbi:type II toxin-antitoxin system VapC family toxin [Andreprevotia chitinilytica]|uniref:type II toxin-antitoxin system VapC family toxin n=1 Tax=Andreprevotia chitinilytica TaxID=396808 RepID=UPI00054D0F56|nr:PIN domain-containing protein [Andreprevotia chitinilytica]